LFSTVVANTRDQGAVSEVDAFVAPFDTLMNQIKQTKPSTLQVHFMYWFVHRLQDSYNGCKDKSKGGRTSFMKRERKTINNLLRFIDKTPRQKPQEPKEIVAWKKEMETLGRLAEERTLAKLKELKLINEDKTRITITKFNELMEKNKDVLDDADLLS